MNSTPLISLCKVGLLDLLEKQYGEITIPEAVFREVGRKNDAVKKQVSSLSWIHVEAIKETKSRRMYKAKLHDGEVDVRAVSKITWINYYYGQHFRSSHLSGSGVERAHLNIKK